jgi:hypothetical protein
VQNAWRPLGGFNESSPRQEKTAFLISLRHAPIFPQAKLTLPPIMRMIDPVDYASIADKPDGVFAVHPYPDWMLLASCARSYVPRGIDRSREIERLAQVRRLLSPLPARQQRHAG